MPASAVGRIKLIDGIKLSGEADGLIRLVLA
jgi:hypothetical protein